MGKINTVFEKVLGFIDKNSTIVIVLVVIVAGAKYFGDIFSMFKTNSENKAQAQEEHTQAVIGTVKAVPKKTGDKKVDAKARLPVINNNVKILSAKFDATCAEEIRKHTTWIARGDYGWFSTPKAELQKLAEKIAKYKGNVSNIAAEYKKAFNDDMYADVRGLMGVDYLKWLSTASGK